MADKILVVDDEKSLRVTLAKFLENAGYSVVTANSFLAAIAMMQDHAFDLIITDIRMQGKSGLDLLSRLRKLANLCPVVMITGYPSMETAQEALRYGACDYLPKPVTKQVLLPVVERTLRFSRSERDKETYRTHLHSLLQSIQDGILTTDTDGIVTMINPAMQELLAVDPSVIGELLSAQTPDRHAKMVTVMQSVFDTARHACAERYAWQDQHDETRILAVTGTPLKNADGGMVGAIIIAHDESRLDRLERTLRFRQGYHRIIGHSAKMQPVYELLDDLAGVTTSVLITGESGTGKGMVAEALHLTGPRGKKPFVKINCAALSETLLESELFGHVRGAFTGAISDRIGKIEKADRGTVFLDEIGDISPRLQLRLLHVIHDRKIERVGDSSTRSVDVRIMAATNRDLVEAVSQGHFREDLYYRLKVVTVEMPPLRKRREDIPQLAEHFRKQFNHLLGKNIQAISEEALTLLVDYPWPGNIRELENAIEHAFVRCRGPVISLSHLPRELFQLQRAQAFPRSLPEELDRSLIEAALQEAGDNKAKAARHLGIDRKTLYRRMKKHDML